MTGVQTCALPISTAAAKIRKQHARVFPGLVKIYDGILQSLEQMRELDVVEQDGELGVSVDARVAFVKASRCVPVFPWPPNPLLTFLTQITLSLSHLRPRRRVPIVAFAQLARQALRPRSALHRRHARRRRPDRV